MTFPTIHDNGTSAQRLAEAYEAAYDAVQAGFEALRETAPNGRDYSDETYERAAAEHRARQGKLREVMAELDELVGHCSKQA